MRILVARCEIAYHGRATTRLAAGDRVILFKDDGSLCVHADRGYKPLTLTDFIAASGFIGSIFGRGGGDEARRSLFLSALRAKLGLLVRQEPGIAAVTGTGYALRGF